MSYRALRRHFAKIADLRHARAMLSWDEAVLTHVAQRYGGGDSLAT